jgi:hypothetical protein
MFLMVHSFNAKVKKRAAGLENSVDTTRGFYIAGKYQRRTGVGRILIAPKVGRRRKTSGRIEKTEHRSAAKNPRWLKACNTTRCDMCEFFFISIEDEIVVNAIAAQS